MVDFKVKHKITNIFFLLFAVITLTENKTYTAWWWRNLINVYYKPHGGTLTTTTTNGDTTYTLV